MKFYRHKETKNRVLSFDNLCNEFPDNVDESFEEWFCNEVGRSFEDLAETERHYQNENEDETDLLNHVYCTLSGLYGNKQFEVRPNPGVQSKHPDLRDCHIIEADPSEIEEY